MGSARFGKRDIHNDLTDEMAIMERISAVTLMIRDMRTSVAFYQALGLRLGTGGSDAKFTTFWAGASALNLAVAPSAGTQARWGRVIFHVSDVDALYHVLERAGIAADFRPRDAAWGERYFHVTDPDGHEISFATPIPDRR